MKSSTRFTTIAGTTMALVMVASATVAAAGPRDRGSSQDEHGFRGRGGPGIGLGFRLRGIDADFQRREVTVQTADGTTSSRVEQGTLDATDDASLTFSLGSGESVTVTLDDDSQLIGFEEREETRRGWSRTRLVPTEIAAADIAAGSDVIVWSGSEDGGDFVASRVVVKPADDADETTAEATDDSAEAADADADATDDSADAEAEGAADAEASEETVTEDAATTDA